MTNNTIPNVPRKLKPCPFCGDIPSENSHALTDGGFKYGAIQCGCGALGPDVRTEYKDWPHWRDAAFAAWNERALLSAPSPAGVDGLEVVRKACEVANCKYPDMDAMADFKRDVTPSVVIGLLDGIRHAKGIAAINDARANGCAETVQFLRLELSDAQAIIDGLRGEAARLREERDSFQRIGIRQIEHRYQLAALLLEKFPRIDPHHPITLSEVDHCCEYVLHKDRERLHCAIDAALSAGKDSGS